MYYWHEKTWSEIRDSNLDVVLLPVGSVEAHGPHLPLATDSIISEELARRSAEELQKQNVRVSILPPLHYVITDYSADFPGTMSISGTTFKSLLNDIAASLSAQGIRTLCIVNSHLEPDHIEAIHEFCVNCKSLTALFPDKTKKPWASLLTPEFKQGACHAGSYETSLVLAVRPELVKDSRKTLPPNPVNLAKLMKSGVKSFRDAGASQAYFGDPAAASAEEGEQTYSILTNMVVTTVMEHLRF
jgi:creatinine amidohydrolase